VSVGQAGGPVDVTIAVSIGEDIIGERSIGIMAVDVHTIAISEGPLRILVSEVGRLQDNMAIGAAVPKGVE
jgi:hypothetical protein